MSSEALIFDEVAFARMSSYVCLILARRDPMDASRFACDVIIYQASCQPRTSSMIDAYLSGHD